MVRNDSCVQQQYHSLHAQVYTDTHLIHKFLFARTPCETVVNLKGWVVYDDFRYSDVSFTDC